MPEIVAALKMVETEEKTRVFTAFLCAHFRIKNGNFLCTRERAESAKIQVIAGVGLLDSGVELIYSKPLYVLQKIGFCCEQFSFRFARSYE